ncbi:MAG: transporter [Hyphomicrobium sp.]|uniref:SphA family protein n=1 Tax=Hyphomicrobium sp. TaxID=82 RepID=UPI0039E56222
MRIKLLSFVQLSLLLCSMSPARADEFGFSSYGLGGSAFGAGAAPPPGTYVTTIFAFYDAKVGNTVTLGNVTLAAGAHVEFFQAAVNGLYVPEWTVFGGRPGLSVTIPTGHIDLAANVSIPPGPGVERETSGWGLGDITTRAQLGWQSGEFAHLAYVQVVAPSGRYDVGFEPDIGLHRPGIDTGWSFTWTEKTSKLQFNGTAGVTFNFENTTTDYNSGTDFHFEWAVGREICTGLMIGVVGYDYRQLTGDSGAGARLGPLEGSVDAIGGGLTYTTLVGKTPVVLSARSYQEFNADKRFEGNSTLGSATIRF